MKKHSIIAVIIAICLISCSKSDDQSKSQRGNIVGLNIKDAEYIYSAGSQMQGRSTESTDYRQIKIDGEDLPLSWIDSNGDTIRVESATKVWNINEEYIMVNTSQPLNNTDPTALKGCSYLVDKQSEAIYDLKILLSGETPITDKNGDIFMCDIIQSRASVKGSTGRVLYKIHTQNAPNLKIEEYVKVTKGSYTISTNGLCFHSGRYIRPSVGTKQYVIDDFTPNTTSADAFTSFDGEVLYLVVNNMDGDLIILKLDESESGEISASIVSQIALSSAITASTIPTKKNEDRGTIVIQFGGSFEFSPTSGEISKLPINLSGFFRDDMMEDCTVINTQGAMFKVVGKSKLEIVLWSDYSTKYIDLADKGIDITSTYSVDGSDLLYFSGFQYRESKSVIGTIDVDGNVEILESTSAPITDLIQTR